MRTRISGPALSVRTCATRLAAVGVRPDLADRGLLVWPHTATAGGDLDGDLDGEISWWGPARSASAAGSEALVQAATGLMHLHGRDLGGQRRLGIEIGSVAAGVLAAQGLLAAAIGRCRGVGVTSVLTSVLQAGLLQASHYLAAATCPPEEVPEPALAPGPPFRTNDGRWFEIETFDTEAWKAFWLRLGAPAAELGHAWTRFRPRYYRGTSSLPVGFHEATAAHSLAEVTAVAVACGVSLSTVRSYDEVLGDAGPGSYRSSGPLGPGSSRSAGPLGPGSSRSAGPLGPMTGTPVIDDLVGAEPMVGPPHRPSGPAAALPLAGLEVVEATSRLQGPMAGLLLQMLGAQVTRVESPGGDVGRSVPPLAGDTGSFFLCFNRGKQTVELDLAKPADRRELADRAATADVFLHNWRPGKGVEWGLAAEDMARINPRLVYAEASGWAPGSAASRLIGTDFLVQAWTGLGNALHPEPDPPKPTRVLLTDFMGALVTCEGVLGGLYRREQTGGGCRVRTSLQGGAMALQAHLLNDLAAGHEHGRRQGRPLWGPLDGPIRASDGWLVVEAPHEQDVRQLSDLCGLRSDGADRLAVEQEITTMMATGPVTGWVARLTSVGLACEPVATDIATMADEPQLASLLEPLAANCRAPASPWQIGT